MSVTWPNGKVKEQGLLKSGFRDGKWQEFYESGRLKCKGKYKKGKSGLYDGELNGFYEDGKKWFNIIYSSDERTEKCEEWDASGKLLRKVAVDYLTKPAFTFRMLSVSDSDSSYVDMEKSAIHWSAEAGNGTKIVYDFRSQPGKFRKNGEHEVIKTLLFAEANVNSKRFLDQLDKFYSDLNWQGKVCLKDVHGRTISDTTYVDDLPGYFFEYVYMADTLAYSKTRMDDRTYYVFPDSRLQEVQKAMGVNANRDENGIFTAEYPDYIEFPSSFPDGTWLFLYSKSKDQTIQDNYGFLRRKVNDTSRYQYSSCHFVLASQEYKDHKANGEFHRYYFYSSPPEYLDDKIAARADLLKPLQFNIPQKYGLYKNGKKDGVFYQFLLDGHTEMSCTTFKEGLSFGDHFRYYTNEKLTGLLFPFMHHWVIFRDHGPAGNVNLQYPAWGYYTLHVTALDNYAENGKKGNWVMFQETYGIPQLVGLELRIEDTITNLQSVVARDKANCKYYSEVFHDENGTVTKWQVFRYGKLKRYGICKPSSVWTQDPEKIRSEEYDDNGDLIEGSTFDYQNKMITTTIFKKGKVVKVEKGPLIR